MWKHLENSYNRVLYFNGERDERINEDNRERMWEEASTIERERELVIHSPFLPCVLHSFDTFVLK